jgi:hypothetical protein
MNMDPWEFDDAAPAGEYFPSWTHPGPILDGRGLRREVSRKRDEIIS